MTKIVQSKELTAFYNAYNEWLKAGAPEENKYNFRRWYGLCWCLRRYYDTNEEVQKNTEKEQDNLFKMANLSECYPFGTRAFDKGVHDKTQHLDPNRIAWVKAHLTEEVDKEFTLQ